MSARDFLASLERGTHRTARKVDGEWVVDFAVKERIIDIFRHTKLGTMPGGFCDKELLTTQHFGLDDGVRMVPGGTSVRAGAHIGRRVVIMPPAYVNIGAYVDEGTMIDSHVLVGSCAQIGKNVHLSAGVQIGGVLEPVGKQPVVVEDDCFIGAHVVLTEGVLVQEKAVLAPGVVLSSAVPVYDVVNQSICKGKIPPCAVVVPGSRPILGDPWAVKEALCLSCAIIVKYRDKKTSAAVALEDALR